MSCAVTLTLPDPLLRAARGVQAKSPVRVDERFKSTLRARLVGDLAAATDWFDLQHRLLKKGVLLREAGGGLTLFVAHDGARLCKASDRGYSPNAPARRFRARFPE